MTDKSIDYTALERLHYLGNYVRPLPVSLARMMENAYDYEHLPFVHPSSFADLKNAASGSWGWRADVELPPKGSGNWQTIELLVDRPKHYWATTVLTGAGEGTQIHTQATATDAGIEVDVRFYLPEAPIDDDTGAMILAYLQTQYKTLYDEDQAMMAGRQEALTRKRDAKPSGAFEPINLGAADDLMNKLPHAVEMPAGRVVVNRYQGEWVVYPAECPHMLGPLEDADIEDDGTIMCPWHGYRFDAKTGAGVSDHGLCLKAKVTPVIKDDTLYLEIV
jgi:nitrite reductase/ring-hydroxylating ferredoxin subunit